MSKLPNTCHEISLAIHNSQTPLQMDFFQIPFNLEPISKPFSRPAHLPFMLMETQFELHQWVFPLVFLLVFCLAQKPYLPPREQLCDIFFFCFSDHAGYCPKGQERTRAVLYRHTGPAPWLSSDLCAVRQGVQDQMNSELSGSSQHQAKGLHLQIDKKTNLWCLVLLNLTHILSW